MKSKKGFWIIIILITLILFFFVLYSMGNNIIEKNYYKDQMLNFCGLAMAQEELIKILNPDFPGSAPNKPCDYWVLGK